MRSRQFKALAGMTVMASCVLFMISHSTSQSFFFDKNYAAMLRTSSYAFSQQKPPGPPHMDNPLAIVFTSFSNRSDKLFVYSNTIRNWATFLPHIQPVLFTTFPYGPVLDIAREHGWYILPNPSTNIFGSPVLKDMYLSAYKVYNATFYGYANGDILFDGGLNDTLSKMSEHRGALNTTLLFGTRRNYDLLPEANYSTEPLWPPATIGQLGNNSHSTLFRHDAFDYFFATKNYPFVHIKPLVIGRSGFDTYFVAVTNNLKLTTIEGTGSITALHQTDHDGNFAHKAPSNKSDTLYNRHLIGKRFNYRPGIASHAKYGGMRGENGKVYLKCRHCPPGNKDLL